MVDPITFTLHAEPEAVMSTRVRARLFADGRLAGTLTLKRREWLMFRAMLMAGVDFAPLANDKPIVVLNLDEGKMIEAGRESTDA